MGYPLYYAGYGGTPPARTGTHHAAIAPYGTFTAGDGAEVVLAIQNEREWVQFCAVVLQRPGLATDPRFDSGSRRVAHRPDLHAAIEEVFGGLTGDEVEGRLAAARVAHGRRRELADVLTHPQLDARGRWTEVDSPAGPLRALRPPIDLPGRDPRMDPVPAVGQHTDDILAWLARPAPLPVTDSDDGLDG
jgi:crotonobetainyl-CoA:carnitine CoA-transferase CaiB-like acyl-CoA transferase